MSGERALLHRYYIERLDRSMMENPHGVFQPLSSASTLRFLEYFDRVINVGRDGLKDCPIAVTRCSEIWKRNKPLIGFL